jgi:hypothetical protein
MHLPFTSSVRTRDYTGGQFSSSRRPEGRGERLDGQQPNVTDLALLTSARRAASSPTSMFPTSRGCAHAVHR